MIFHAQTPYSPPVRTRVASKDLRTAEAREPIEPQELHHVLATLSCQRLDAEQLPTSVIMKPSSLDVQFLALLQEGFEDVRAHSWRIFISLDSLDSWSY